MRVDAYDFVTLRRSVGWDFEFYRINWSFIVSSPPVHVNTPSRVESDEYDWVYKSLMWFGRFE